MERPKEIVDWVQTTPTFYLLMDDIGHNSEMIHEGFPTWFIGHSELIAKFMCEKLPLYANATKWEIKATPRAEVAKYLDLLRKATGLERVSIIHFVHGPAVAKSTFTYEEFHLALNYIFTGQHKHESSL